MTKRAAQIIVGGTIFAFIIYAILFIILSL